MTPSYDRYLDALLDRYTALLDDAGLPDDEWTATWCDEHRDAWIAAVDAETAEEVTL